MKWKFWNNDRELERLADILDKVIDNQIKNPEINSENVEPHYEFNEEAANQGRTWKYEKDGKTKYFTSET